MHKTLARQIERYIKDPEAITSQWDELLDAVSATYESFDQDRLLIERSLEISSHELKGMIGLLQATLDSTSEGIIVIDNKGKILNYNKRFQEIWAVPEDIMKTHDSEKATEYTLGLVFDTITFRKNISNALSKTNESSSYMVKLKDGRTIDVNSIPQLVDGTSTGRVWSFRDVTKHLVVEGELNAKLEALERMNRAMVDRELKMIELKKKIAQLETGMS